MENWKTIEGLPNFYEVSNTGQVRTWHGRGQIKLTQPVLKSIHFGKGGYRIVRLYYKRGKRKWFRVAALVLTAFDGPRPKGHEVSHLFGNKLDERIEALAWETPEQNRDREVFNPKSSQPKVKRSKVVLGRLAAQRKRIRARINAGLCACCGAKRGLYKTLCDRCRERQTEQSRRRRGCSAWVPGGKGSAPLWASIIDS